MSNEVRQIDPAEWDDELTEVWVRETSEEPHLLNVHAIAGSLHDGWQVGWWAGEYFRQEPLGVELRQRFQGALRAVPGVTSVGEQGWETWEVYGNPSGEALCRAAASVVDEFADRMRVAYEEMFEQSRCSARQADPAGTSLPSGSRGVHEPDH